MPFESHAPRRTSSRASARSGDEALRRYCKDFDGWRWMSSACHRSASTPHWTTSTRRFWPRLKRPRSRFAISTSARSSSPGSPRARTAPCWASRLRRVRAAGIYVPGGPAQYPLTVLMNAIPAKVAGVERVVMVTPPQRDGGISPIHAGCGQGGGRGRGLHRGRRAGHRRAGIWHAVHSARREDHRSRQRVRGGCQAPGFGRGGHRHDRRPLRGVRVRRTPRPTPPWLRRTLWRRRSTIRWRLATW